MSAANINWNHLPGEDNIFRTVLPNGIIVLCKSDFNSPSIVISGYLQSGSIQDPKDKLGLALFTSYALMRGTANRRFKRIYHDLESAGASFGFGASVQTTSFGGRALVEDLPLLLNTLADCVQWPVFPPRQFSRLQAQLMIGLQLREQDTGDMASLKFDETLFPNHPYGIPEDGYPETVQHIHRRDLVKFHNQSYSPKGMVIVLVGAIEPQQAFESVNKILGGWKNPGYVLPPPIPDIPGTLNPVHIHLPIQGKFQTDLVMGCYAPSRIDVEYLPASIGNNILGQFGMMGRIGAAVREKSGLAYYASTSLNSWLKGGSWEINAGVNPINLEASIRIIKEEIKKFIAEPVTQEELNDSKSNFIGLLPLSVESNSGVANSIIRMERFGLGLNYLREYPGKIQKITSEEILQVSKKYLNPENMVIVSAGPDLAENINEVSV
ncbi:MAG: hypothetical protein CVU39_04855 [Chloroflexi bacterium HGW-Chloroflexi-10]|nr:MAG: hypothetical protein CVU39_04855 [Chloroflexi bacterium HGW-Chloroflexi-10]